MNIKPKSGNPCGLRDLKGRGWCQGAPAPSVLVCGPLRKEDTGENHLCGLLHGQSSGPHRVHSKSPRSLGKTGPAGGDPVEGLAGVLSLFCSPHLPVPNQMHYRVFSPITRSGGAALFLIQLSSSHVVSYTRLPVPLTQRGCN